MTYYNIIGDIHGRRVWENLVQPNMINIFVGDYFDPYDRFTYEELRVNFLDIIQFAKTNPGTVLLLGNHDLHYIHHEFGTSRKDSLHENQIEQLFLDNIHMFSGIAFALTDQVLVSHAGVTNEWLDMTMYPVNVERNARKIAEHVNNVFYSGYVEKTFANGHTEHDWGSTPWDTGLKYFQFGTCADWNDVYGDSPTQSPVWVRPMTLAHCTALPEGTQIVGHTQARMLVPEAIPHIIIVDTLGQGPASLIAEVDGEKVTYRVNKLQ
jgi:hypothetical protein